LVVNQDGVRNTVHSDFCVFPKAKDSISCLLHLNPVDSHIYQLFEVYWVATV
ncbi:Uncharacterized protein APZ42_003578, partial [Daphnia magna]